MWLGWWKNTRLDKAFKKADNSRREQSEVVPIFTQLSTIERDTLEGWQDYLQVYYTNFEVLHDWAKLPFHRRWRRTREIKKEQILARTKNTLLCSETRLPPMSNLRNRTRQLDLCLQDRKLVAWGNENFGMRRGQAPMPNKGLYKYVGRFAPVILFQNHIATVAN
jgi:hypothetical protein